MVVDLLRRDDDTGLASVDEVGSLAKDLVEAVGCRSCTVARHVDTAACSGRHLGHRASMEDRWEKLGKSRDLLAGLG